MNKVVPGTEEERHPRDMAKSLAWLKLSNAGKIILLELYRRRTGRYEGTDNARRWVWLNNGEIEFPEEQYRLFGLTRPRFQRGKASCKKWGFLSWTRGGGKDHITCKYTLLEDWRQHGCVTFKSDRTKKVTTPATSTHPDKRPSRQKRVCVRCGSPLNADLSCPKCNRADDW